MGSDCKTEVIGAEIDGGHISDVACIDIDGATDEVGATTDEVGAAIDEAGESFDDAIVPCASIVLALVNLLDMSPWLHLSVISSALSCVKNDDADREAEARVEFLLSEGDSRMQFVTAGVDRAIKP